MTVNLAIPLIILEGDGTLTTFPYSFPIVEDVDLLVFVDDVLQVQYSTYTLENVTDDGGEVEFIDTPADGAIVLILRATTKSQQTDYTEAPFPSETHEGVVDKITFILQELISGAFTTIDSDGNIVYLTFDLDAVANTTTVTITNSGGTDADIPAWTNAEFAGVYHGETSLEASLPADEEATTKPDGYVWLGY